MQLILDTENTNINLGEKMTTLAQGTSETLVSNGETNELFENSINKSENSLSAKGIENKENVTANTEDCRDSENTVTVQPTTEYALPETNNEKSDQINGKSTEEIIMHSEEHVTLVKESSEIKPVANSEQQLDEDIALKNNYEKDDVIVQPECRTNEQPQTDIGQNNLVGHTEGESPVTNYETSKLQETQNTENIKMDIDDESDIFKEKESNEVSQEASKTSKELEKCEPVDDSPVTSELNNVQSVNQSEEKLVPQEISKLQNEMVESSPVKKSPPNETVVCDIQKEVTKAHNEIEESKTVEESSLSENLKVCQMEMDEEDLVAPENNAHEPTKTNSESVVPMEVEDNVTQHLEEQVTESISAIVSEIVNNLHEDDIDGVLDSNDGNDMNLSKEATSETKAHFEEHDMDNTEQKTIDTETNQNTKVLNEAKDMNETIEAKEKTKDSSTNLEILESATSTKETDVPSTANEKNDECLQSCESNATETDVLSNIDKLQDIGTDENTASKNVQGDLPAEFSENTQSRADEKLPSTESKSVDELTISVDRNTLIIEEKNKSNEDVKPSSEEVANKIESSVESETKDVDENVSIETSESEAIYKKSDITVCQDKISEDFSQATSSEEVLKDKFLDKIQEKANEVKLIEENEIPEVSKAKEKVSDNSVEVEANEESKMSEDVLQAKVSDNVEEIKVIEGSGIMPEPHKENEKITEVAEPAQNSQPIIKLSNTMDILSDDEDVDEAAKDTPKKSQQEMNATESTNKQYINLDDDDDVMVIDVDTPKVVNKDAPSEEPQIEKEVEQKSEERIVELDTSKEDETNQTETVTEKGSPKPDTETKDDPKPELEKISEADVKTKPLVPDDFFKTYRKNLADMTRDDLEEFCILKIVESIIDRSNINEIRAKLKTMSQSVEEFKKKASMLTKQNRDLQVVLKSVQEEQKKSQSLTPLKIMRSVGMQVLMTDKPRRRPQTQASLNTSNNISQVNNSMNNININNRQPRNMNPSPRGTPQKQANSQPIPVPRLVPAAQNTNNRNLAGPPPTNSKTNNISNIPTGKLTSPSQKGPEKRPHSKIQSNVTVDLTDDEPPLKVPAKNSSTPPVRLVNTQNLLAQRPPIPQAVNSPRKVYIPINLNGPPGQNIRPGQTVMLRPASPQGPRPRTPLPPLRPTKPNNMPIKRVSGSRHPAPLPDAMKQYQPPNWKALPPPPDLKLSKVENGIVISWKIEGYQEDSYEEIASYQLYAYQETSAPPSTSLWKKIGDVKALPLPMACTLTQFMAGYRYYFAVRAVDIRSRLGPFSLPGSILLLNKM